MKHSVFFNVNCLKFQTVSNDAILKMIYSVLKITYNIICDSFPVKYPEVIHNLNLLTV